MTTAQPPSASPVASKCRFLPRFLPRCLPAPLKCPILKCPPTRSIRPSPRPLPPSCRLLRSRRPFPVPVLPAIRSRAAAPGQELLCWFSVVWSPCRSSSPSPSLSPGPSPSCVSRHRSRHSTKREVRGLALLLPAPWFARALSPSRPVVFSVGFSVPSVLRAIRC
jgi:hypothetical protein